MTSCFVDVFSLLQFELKFKKTYEAGYAMMRIKAWCLMSVNISPQSIKSIQKSCRKRGIYNMKPFNMHLGVYFFISKKPNFFFSYMLHVEVAAVNL